MAVPDADAMTPSARTDPLTPEQRSRHMARIRGKDTKPELLLRRGLHARGLRYRLHARGLRGRPDLVFAGPRVAAFVHGCFWHGHDCPLHVTPASNTPFWVAKIDRNRERDADTARILGDAGWRLLTVWECALRGRARRDVTELLDDLATWIRRGHGCREVGGLWPSRPDGTAPRGSLA